MKAGFIAVTIVDVAMFTVVAIVVAVRMTTIELAPWRIVMSGFVEAARLEQVFVTKRHLRVSPGDQLTSK